MKLVRLIKTCLKVDSIYKYSSNAIYILNCLRTGNASLPLLFNFNFKYLIYLIRYQSTALPVHASCM